MLKPKVVLVTMFEPEEIPGELHFYREHYQLEPYALPEAGLEAAFVSPDRQILALVAGVGTANTAISIMALGLAAEGIDLRESYWLISGIAGGNPSTSSLGSVVFADWCVDGDLAFEIDAREIPEPWSTGVLPLGARKPYGPSTMPASLFGRPYQVFRLNEALIEQARAWSVDVALKDTPEITAFRQQFTDYTQAVRAPGIQIGSTLAAARFWHGSHFNTWAEQWVQHWTEGAGTFFTSGMEDTGTLHALKHLERLGKVSFERVLILRAVSNFTQPPPSMDLATSLVGDGDAGYPGHLPALENGCRVGRCVIDRLLS